MLKDLHTYLDERSNKQFIKDFSRKAAAVKRRANPIPPLKNDKVMSQINEKLEINRKFLVLDSLTPKAKVVPIDVSSQASISQRHNLNVPVTFEEFKSSYFTPRVNHGLDPHPFLTGNHGTDSNNYLSPSSLNINFNANLNTNANINSPREQQITSNLSNYLNKLSRRAPVHSFSTLVKNKALRKFYRESVNETVEEKKQPLKLELVNSNINTLLKEVRKSAKKKIQIPVNKAVASTTPRMLSSVKHGSEKSFLNESPISDKEKEKEEALLRTRIKSKIGGNSIVEKTQQSIIKNHTLAERNASSFYNSIKETNMEIKKNQVEFENFKKNVLDSNNLLKFVKIRSKVPITGINRNNTYENDSLTLSDKLKGKSKSILLNNNIHGRYLKLSQKANKTKDGKENKNGRIHQFHNTSNIYSHPNPYATLEANSFINNNRVILMESLILGNSTH